MSLEEGEIDFAAKYKELTKDGASILRGLESVSGKERHFKVVGSPDAQYGLTPEQVREKVFQILKNHGVDVKDSFKDGINLEFRKE